MMIVIVLNQIHHEGKINDDNELCNYVLMAIV